jgi:hypothetical protein
VNWSFGVGENASMSTNISIYGGLDEDDQLYRDDLEDALRGLLKGAGRVTGGGCGGDGFNVDLSLADGEDLESWVGRLSKLLQRLGAGASTSFEVFPSGWKPGLGHRRVQVSGEERFVTGAEE